MKLISQNNESEESDLAREIIQFTERPKHIKNLISKFIRLYSGNRKNPTFMTIHWRYDENDWKNEQCKRKPDFLICKDFDIMRDPERLSNEIENYLSSLEDDFDFIYIAAPPSESRVGKFLKVIWQWGDDGIKGKIDLSRISWPIRF
jgi:hypothetical protein